ncbi:MAG: hypothetical protein ACR2M1_02300 [Gemmatimonadaceae bacterium]
MTPTDLRPLAIVISGPSGSGKTTAASYLTSKHHIHRVVTYTTRPRREWESNGREYRFVHESEFQRLLDNGTIVEYTRKYPDHHYGSTGAAFRREGPPCLVVEMDLLGFLRLRARSARRVVGIFIAGPTEQVLERRRLSQGAAFEQSRYMDQQHLLPYASIYDHVVVNDRIDEFEATLTAILHTETCATEAARWLVQTVR